jgi:hypothetical protein
MAEPDYNTKREFQDPYTISECNISKEISDESHRLWKYGFEVVASQQSNVQGLARHAKILTLLSRQADVQAAKIVRLTWALVGLTAALLLFTVFLSYDAYAKSKGHKTKELNDSQPQQFTP